MRKCKIVCSALTILFSAAGLMKLLSYDISLPLMSICLGLTLTAGAVECNDKGSKSETVMLGGTAAFIFVVTAYNIASRMI